jgi:hypothetical protein
MPSAPPRSAANARKVHETDDDVLTRLEGGATQRALAGYYGCSRSAVKAAADRARAARAQAEAEAPTSRTTPGQQGQGTGAPDRDR